MTPALLRYALRRLAGEPVLAIVATLSLALGIGANTAAFELLHAVLLRHLPVRDPATLVNVATRTDAAPGYGLSYPTYAALRDGTRGIESAIAFADTPVTVRTVAAATRESAASAPVSEAMTAAEGAADRAADSTTDRAVDRANGVLVSGNYFEMLGVPMAIGTPIRASDDVARGAALDRAALDGTALDGATHDRGAVQQGGAVSHRGIVVVLAHAYWTRRFNADPGVIGRGLHVNGQPATIVGVAAAAFRGTRSGAAPDLFLPMAVAPRLYDIPNRLENPGDRWLRIMARLAPGVTRAQAQGEMTAALRRFNAERVLPLAKTDEARARVRATTIVLLPGGSGLSELPSDVRPTLYALMGLVGVVLLLACVNVANLLLARAERQQRETAIQIALGASSRRLWMQAFVECLLLGAAGLTLGLLLATWMRGLFVPLLPIGARLASSAITSSAIGSTPTGSTPIGSTPIGSAPLESVLHGTVFAAALAMALAAALGLAITVAWQRGRPSLTPALRDGDVVSRRWIRRGLIVGQLALSIVLLVAALLFVRTLRNLEQVDPGFAREQVLLASFDPRAYPRARQHEIHRRLFETARAMRGVSAAALTSDEPLRVGTVWNMRVSARASAADWQLVPVLFVSPGYFETLRVQLIAGRDLRDADLAAGAPPVLLVNDAFVARYLTRSPVDKTTSRAQPSSIATAVGARVLAISRDEPFTIVGVARDTRINGLRDASEPTMYLPMTANALPGRMVLHLRTRAATASAAPIAAAIDATLRREYPDMTMFNVRPLEEHLAAAAGRERTFAQLASLMGLLALALSGVGLYGLTVSSVSRRTRELGIRIALGSSRGAVLRLVLREVAGLVLCGLLVGLPLAYALGRALASLLYGVAPGDWPTLTAASAVLAIVTLAAAWLPARRAARVDPLIALRYD